MIGVDEKYVFRFSLDGDEDFIEESELIKFTMIEEAGNLLPTFQLIFETDDEKIIPKLNEGNVLEVSYGRTIENMVDAELNVTRLQTGKVAQGQRRIGVSGLVNAGPYITNSQIFITTEKSGVEAMNEVASQHFKVISNISKSRDKQRWIQANINARSFINDIWLHADLGNSFPLIGITTDKKFLIKDFNTMLNAGFRWRFTTEIEDKKKDITYDSNYDTDSKTGLMNNWFGYGREQTVFDYEAGTEDQIFEKPDPVLALTKDLARRADIEKRFFNPGAKSENVHPRFHQTALHNMGQLISLGALELTVPTEGVFFPISILDLVMFRDATVDREQGEGSTNDFNSGLYVIGKVARTIENRQFVTMSTIFRESFNSVKTTI